MKIIKRCHVPPSEVASLYEDELADLDAEARIAQLPPNLCNAKGRGDIASHCRAASVRAA
ncbi:MAG: hypothetical protein ABJA77_08765 [Variovorax sp.]